MSAPMAHRDIVDTLASPSALRPWFAARVEGAVDAPLYVRHLVGGQSNEVFVVEQRDHRWVLRRPAGVALPRADEGMRREYRVLRALRDTDAPHPRAFAFCDDASIIGSVFYVMAYVDGFIPADPLPAPYADDRDARRDLGLAIIDALAALHTVDWRGVGLDGFGRPEGFLERQVARWRGQLDSYRTRELAGIEIVEQWLADNTPPQQAAAIMHGDYHFGNLLVAPDPPARVAAIVDWENATIGDPLLDFAYLLSTWPDPDAPGGTRLQPGNGLPTRAEVCDRYYRRTGRSLDALDFYTVLSQYKLACMLEGIYARQREAGKRDTAQLESYVLRLVENARSVIGGS